MNDIKFYQERITEYRNKLIDAVINKIHDYDSFMNYYPELNDYLRIGKWCNESPTFIDGYLDGNDYYDKHEVVYFDYIISNIQDEYSLSKEETYEDYIIPTLEYIKTNKNCLTLNDW